MFDTRLVIANMWISNMESANENDQTKSNEVRSAVGKILRSNFQDPSHCNPQGITDIRSRLGILDHLR